MARLSYFRIPITIFHILYFCSLFCAFLVLLLFMIEAFYRCLVILSFCSYLEVRDIQQRKLNYVILTFFPLGLSTMKWQSEWGHLSIYVWMYLSLRSFVVVRVECHLEWFWAMFRGTAEHIFGCVWVYNGGMALRSVSGSSPLSVWHCFTDLHCELSFFALSCLSTVMFLPWSQLGTVRIPRNHEPN